MLESTNSTPTLSEFDPKVIPYQYRVIQDVFSKYDYSLGVHEILLSGSVGSAKSILMAHVGVLHCLNNEKAIGLLGRKSLPDLRDTLLRKILDHMGDDVKEGVHYEFNETSGRILFYNGSEMICRSWADKRYRKLRSLDLSFALIEELTENNNDEFESFYKELRARVGRLPRIKQNFIMCATNPDAPSHSAYDYFIASKIPTRHVYYSNTRDNPFLPDWYINQLLETFTAQEARRMIGGEWIELRSEVIYYAFDEGLHVIDSYVVDPKYPVVISYDFNIGLNKPMSVILFQYIKEKFYFFAEVVINGSNTLETCDEMIARNLWNYPTKYIVRGDAAGRSKSSKYNRSDYDIIKKAMEDYMSPDGRMDVEIDVPLSNPPIRKRHIIVNGQLKNALSETHIAITKNCTTAIKGMRLAKLKKGGAYIEDDSDPWQHITTAIGYGILRELENKTLGDRFNQGDIYGNKINERRGFAQSRIS